MGEDDKEILKIFEKMKINIPLLIAIKRVPRYACFLKELCINMNKLKGNDRIPMGENVSTVLQKKLPVKEKDPCMFIISCKISDYGIKKGYV